jgi:tripartite-type tricarboxylate transporter receptor subunit TctC
MPSKLRRGWLFAAIVSLAVISVPSANAQSFPSKTLTIVVPYAAGGSNDLIARQIAPRLSERLGQSVIIENKPGAGSNIGSSFVAKSPPDGHTLLLGSSANAVNPSLYKNMNFNPLKDLIPLVLVGTSPNVLIVHPSVPAQNVAEFVALAKAKPGSLTYSSSGPGGAMHLSGELFELVTGVHMLHVPYNGGGPALNALLGGQVNAMFDNVITATAQVNAGKVRALAVTTASRSPALPNVPTMAEAGYKDYEAFVWWGVFVPAGTPQDTVIRLQNEIVGILKTPEMTSKLQSQGITVLAGGNDEFTRFYKQEYDKWASVIKRAGIKAE